MLKMSKIHLTALLPLVAGYSFYFGNISLSDVNFTHHLRRISGNLSSQDLFSNFSERGMDFANQSYHTIRAEGSRQYLRLSETLTNMTEPVPEPIYPEHTPASCQYSIESSGEPCLFVLLVHGVGLGREALTEWDNYLSQSLKKNGKYKNVVMLKPEVFPSQMLGRFSQDVVGGGDVLTSFITDRVKYGHGLAILGFGAGGLWGRQAIRVLEKDGWFDTNKINTELFATFGTPHLGIDSPVKQLMPWAGEKLQKNIEATISNRASSTAGSDLLTPLSDLLVTSSKSFLVDDENGLFDANARKSLKRFVKRQAFFADRDENTFSDGEVNAQSALFWSCSFINSSCYNDKPVHSIITQAQRNHIVLFRLPAPDFSSENSTSFADIASDWERFYVVMPVDNPTIFNKATSMCSKSTMVGLFGLSYVTHAAHHLNMFCTNAFAQQITSTLTFSKKESETKDTNALPADLFGKHIPLECRRSVVDAGDQCLFLVLVHGMISGTESLVAWENYIDKAMPRRNYHEVVILTPELFRNAIGRFAVDQDKGSKILVNHVKDRVSAGHAIAFVSFSFGGIWSRAAVRSLEAEDWFQRNRIDCKLFATVSSPHVGGGEFSEKTKNTPFVKLLVPLLYPLGLDQQSFLRRWFSNPQDTFLGDQVKKSFLKSDEGTLRFFEDSILDDHAIKGLMRFEKRQTYFADAQYRPKDTSSRNDDFLSWFRGPIRANQQNFSKLPEFFDGMVGLQAALLLNCPPIDKACWDSLPESTREVFLNAAAHPDTIFQVPNPLPDKNMSFFLPHHFEENGIQNNLIPEHLIKTNMSQQAFTNLRHLITGSNNSSMFDRYYAVLRGGFFDLDNSTNEIWNGVSMCSKMQMNHFVRELAMFERFATKDMKETFLQWFHHGVIFCSDLLADSIIKTLEPTFHHDQDLSPRKAELYPSNAPDECMSDIRRWYKGEQHTCTFVVLVHGLGLGPEVFGMGWSDFLNMHLAGKKVVVLVPDLNENFASRFFQSLNSAGDVLSKYIKERVPQGHSLAVLGFSVGGLWARESVRLLEKDRWFQENEIRCRLFATFGAPHLGMGASFHHGYQWIPELPGSITKQFDEYALKNSAPIVSTFDGLLDKHSFDGLARFEKRQAYYADDVILTEKNISKLRYSDGEISAQSALLWPCDLNSCANISVHFLKFVIKKT